jgi:molecular chaperone GrpE
MSKDKAHKKQGAKKKSAKEKKLDVEPQEKDQNLDNEQNKPSMEEMLAQEKDKFLRLFAEFENYKKRTAKERLEIFKTGNRELMTALLPLLDDFDRAMAEINRAEDDELSKGVALIQQKFKSVLETKGLQYMKVEQGDSFDAEIHQAITQIPAPSKDLKGKIIDVTEAGYRLGDTIIRFPKVVVGQ